MPVLIPADWEVPAVFRRRLGDGAGRQRAMFADGHLLLVLHQLPGPGVPERSACVFWREPAGEWHSNLFGQGVQAVRRHLAEFGERIDKLEDRWQEARTAAEYYSLLQAIAPVHRTVRHMHATFQQARELLPDDRDMINLRDRAGDLERACELLHGDARNGLDFTVAFQSEEQSRQAHEMAVSAHRLNLLAALFFPLATISSVFGMELVHGLEEWNRPYLFWALVAAAFVSGLLLAVVIARQPREPRLPGPRAARSGPATGR